MPPLVSQELRWFLPGKRFAELDHWFSDTLPGPDPGPVEERTDLYLHLPHQDDLSLKLRSGELVEVKWRESALRYDGPHGTAGMLERWVKWSWIPYRGPDPAELMGTAFPDGPWIAVTKRRRQRYCGWSAGTIDLASPIGSSEAGAVLELAAVEVHGQEHTTVLLETLASGDDVRRLLDTAVSTLWQEFPSPRPAFDQSGGYPRWLARSVVGRA